jgi:hypothetical protein
MASTLIKVIVGFGALAIGVGFTLFFKANCVKSCPLPTDTNSLILIGIVMTVFSYIALYFMTKGSGS